MHTQVFIKELNGHFCLRNPGGTEPTLIYLNVRLKGKVYKLSTGVKVRPDQWDVRHRCALTGSALSALDNHNNAIVNRKLNEVRQKFRAFRLWVANAPESLDGGIAHLRKMMYSETCDRRYALAALPKSDDSAVSVLRRMVYQSQNAESSKMQHITNLEKFERFLAQRSIPDSFEQMNADTLRAYQDFLVSEGRAPTTIRNIIRGTLFALLRKAGRDAGIPFKWETSNLESFELVRDKSNRELSDNKRVALTEEQVRAIYSYRLTAARVERLARKRVSERQLADLQEIKDLFVLQCYVGQRISDMPKFFNGEAVYDEKLNIVTLVQQKTQATAIVPLFRVASEIISRYQGRGISAYRSNRIGGRLKFICRLVGLNDTVTYQQNGETFSRPLYQLVHSHTARHTFVTIMCRRGIDREQIITMTGHHDTTMVNEVYSHLTLRDNALKLVEELERKGLLDKKPAYEIRTDQTASGSLIDELHENCRTIEKLQQRNCKIIEVLKSECLRQVSQPLGGCQQS